METQNINEEIQIFQAQGAEIFEAQERASIDIQISTAKRFPRDIIKVLKNSMAIVSMDEETARTCRYSKPIEGKKTVNGPSVHLARIIVQQYGNIRIVKRIKQVTERTVIAEAVAFDLENNYAIAAEARRSIWSNSNNRRFSDTTIETNAMAVMSIAERNVILQIIPKTIVDKVYEAAFNTANGDLSDEQKVLIAREKAFKYFAETYGATEQEVLNSLGLNSLNQINAEKVAEMRGFIQALKDGDTTPDILFNREKKVDLPKTGKMVESNKKEPNLI